jgi:nitrite reductase/ring-hydroxylating ferredoxin subunit
MAFVKVAELSEVPEGRGALVEKNGVAIALFNAGGGRIYATSPVCPHEDGPLADGWIEAGAVVCPWHGFDFDLATGECRVDRDLAISVYPARVNGSAVEVDLP